MALATALRWLDLAHKLERGAKYFRHNSTFDKQMDAAAKARRKSREFAAIAHAR